MHFMACNVIICLFFLKMYIYMKLNILDVAKNLTQNEEEAPEITSIMIFTHVVVRI